MEDDPMSLIDAEMSRLKAEVRIIKRENERLQAHADLLDFCLTQARIVLEHFSAELPDPEHRKIATGGLIASAPPGTLPGDWPS